jgi:uncharacterized cupredoxin-like copper-binding protein
MVSKVSVIALVVAAMGSSFGAVVTASANNTSTKATTVTVSAGKPSEFKFKLSKLTVPSGAVTFAVTNAGTIPHDFKVCSSSKGGTATACAGKATATLAPKKTAKLTITFKTKGKYEFLCTLPGHAAAGMKGILTVT